MKTLEQEVFELLEKSKMNYSVVKEPLHLPDGKQTQFFGVVRSDDKTCFGTCTDRYEVFQNHEMAELAFKIKEESGYKIDRSRVYRDGAKVSIDLVGEEVYLEYPKVGDLMQKSIRMTNTHDGSGALKLALGSLVLSCTNGMTRWVEGRGASIRHTTNMKSLIDNALRSFEFMQEKEQNFIDEIKKMIEVDVNENQIADLMQSITDVDVRKVSMSGGTWKSDEYSTRAINKTVSLFESIKEEIDYKGANAWGLLNGVTHFTSHKAGRDSSRSESKVFGGLMQTDKKAYDFCLNLV